MSKKEPTVKYFSNASAVEVGMMANTEITGHTKDLFEGDDFHFKMIDSAVDEERETIPEEDQQLKPEGVPPLTGTQVMSLCICGRLGTHRNKRAFDQAKCEARQRHAQTAVAVATGTKMQPHRSARKREREVVKRKNDVTSTKERVEKETLPDGTVREGVERETTVDKSTVEVERIRELEEELEHSRDMVNHLEMSIRGVDDGSALNANTYDSECGAYIVRRTLALAKKALRELVDEQVLEEWMDNAGASPTDTPCFNAHMQDELEEMGRAEWKNHINGDLERAGWTRQDLDRMVFPH